MSKDDEHRSGFVHVGDLALDLPGVQVPARRRARHFTQLDQVTQLVAVRDADPDIGFMARLLALCSLPRSNPGKKLQYERVNGLSVSNSLSGRHWELKLHPCSVAPAEGPEKCGPRRPRMVQENGRGE